MERKENFKTKRAAESHAAKLRREWPKMKPVRVVKGRYGGWDVYASH